MENALFLALNIKENNMAAKITFETATHLDKEVIFIRFPYDKEAIQRVRKLDGVKWSQSEKAWYVLDTQYYRKKFGLKEKPLGKDCLAKIHPINQTALTNLIELLQLKSYSQSTIKTYRNEFAQLLYILKDYPVENCNSNKLKSYFLYCINELKLTEATIHSRINAIKFYFEQVLKRDKLFFDIPRPKKPLQIPSLFSKEEIQLILNNTENLKHKTMLMLCYSTGLRVSEVVGLRIKDIDSKRMVIYIKCAKGKKDRVVPLSQTALKYLREYAKQYKPKDFLFEGQYLGMPYSARSMQIILSDAKKKSNIKRKGSVHALRHSYATHLLDKGVDITYIQKILGHNDLKTTLRYLHVTTRDLNKIESPLEDLGF
jgi:site-specific recombinase XerD